MAIRKIHDVSPRTGLDQAMFWGALLLGILPAVWLKLTHADPVLPMVWTGGVLLLYALLTALTGRLRLEPDAVGDNCYYMGFLFTLSSLAVTLWQVGAGGEMSQASQIISGFGVALSSTIIGVALRVGFMQMRADYAATEREARLELDQAMRKFRGHLSHATRDIKAFSVESVQQSQERQQRIGEETEANAKTQIAMVQEHADRIAAALEKRLADATEALAATMDQRLKESAQLLTDQAEAAATRRSDLEARALERQAALFSSNGEAFSDLHQEVIGAQGKVQSFAAAVDGTTQKIDKLAVELSTTMERQLGGTVERLAENIDRRLNRSLDEMTSRFAANEALRAEAENTMRTAMQRVTTNLDAMTRAAEINQDRVNGVQQSFMALDGKLSSLGRELGDHVGRLLVDMQRLSKLTANELPEGFYRVDRASRSLTEVLDGIAGRIGGPSVSAQQGVLPANVQAPTTVTEERA